MVLKLTLKTNASWKVSGTLSVTEDNLWYAEKRTENLVVAKVFALIVQKVIYDI